MAPWADQVAAILLIAAAFVVLAWGIVRELRRGTSQDR